MILPLLVAFGQVMKDQSGVAWQSQYFNHKENQSSSSSDHNKLDKFQPFKLFQIFFNEKYRFS